MSPLTATRMAELLEPYFPGPAPELLDRLGVFLDLLLKWNARTNLTAIRDPEEIVRRHFGESLFVARNLPPCQTLLDLGSGAGFPGIPIQLAKPDLRVTLAESQHKKASFLREAVRTLGLVTEVYADRVERMPVERLFDVVALRAVDRPLEALKEARRRLAPGGTIAHLTVAGADEQLLKVPGSRDTVLHLHRF